MHAFGPTLLDGDCACACFTLPYSREYVPLPSRRSDHAAPIKAHDAISAHNGVHIHVQRPGTRRIYSEPRLCQGSISQVSTCRCRAPEPASASLQFVAVPHNAGVDDAWLAQLAERCRDLETLDVSGCAHVSDKGIKQVLLKCQSLRVLRLT